MSEMCHYRKWPSHSIASSAAAKKAIGTFMSSALAVVRLMPRLAAVGPRRLANGAEGN